MNDTDVAIHHIFTRYQTAVLAKDVHALASLYADDVRIFDMWGQWAYVGSNSWRGLIVAWFDSLGDDLCAVHFDDIRVNHGGELAAAHAFVKYQAQTASGEVIRSLHERLSWVLQATATGWSIVHQHTSAPLDFETGKAIFERGS
jgi:uncharacterized protein (TIGR02246 family)